MSEQVAAPKLPAIIASRYVPIRLIGRGGMGMVYEVEHARTGERLALKVLLSTVDTSPDAIARFKREARASARIKSENVVRVIDADVAPELDGAPFLVMELLEGMDIEKAARASRPTAATVVEWLRQVARAVDKAHRLGIVHRDLKPENLFLADVEDRAPIVKVLDFGIAKMAQEGTTATGSGEVLGTPKYMAPEQATGTARVTPATDLYALGLVAYRLIMGESYYQDDNVMSILGRLLHGPLQLPSARNPNFGAAFDDWFKKACHKEPEGRFASAAVQVEALADALGLPILAIEIPRDRASPDRFAPVDAAPPRERSSPDGSAPVDPAPPRKRSSSDGSAPVDPTPMSTPSSVPMSARHARTTVALILAAAVAAVIAIGVLFVYRRSSADRLAGATAVATSAPPPSAPVAEPPPAVTPTGSASTAEGSAEPAQPSAPTPWGIPIKAPALAPDVSPGGARSRGKKARPAVIVPDTATNAKPPAAQLADPFRDQK